METREWIGQSRARNPARGEITGGSQFFLVYRPNRREAIARQILAHGMTGLHGRCMVDFERNIYNLGAEVKLPFPQLIATDKDTTTTELVGPSVRMLLERPDLPVALTEDEAAALLVHTLRAKEKLADAGFMTFDGHLHNAWVWLERGLQGGHLDFQRILLGDHSYSCARGMENSRPLWCSSEAAHFPPEARLFKLADDSALARMLNNQGFIGTALGDIVRNIARITDDQERRNQRWRLERAYENYDAPQQLQAALDNGAIQPHRMMQYAVAQCLLGIAGNAGLPEASSRMIARCRRHLERMADIRPEARFSTLGEAAEAIAGGWDMLPQRSLRPWPAISPRFLIWDVRGGTDPEPSSGREAANGDASRQGTFGFDDGESGWASPARHGDTRHFNRVWSSRIPHVAGWLLKRPLLPLLALALAGAVATGVREPWSPEDALREARKAEVRHLVQQAGAQDPAAATDAVRQLKLVLGDDRDPLREFAKEIVEIRYRALERRHLNKLHSKVRNAMLMTNSKELQEVVHELEVLAELGQVKSSQWLNVLRRLHSHSINPTSREHGSIRGQKYEG